MRYHVATTRGCQGHSAARTRENAKQTPHPCRPAVSCSAGGAAMTQQLDDWNTRNIKEFRDSGGKIAQFGDAPVLLITHSGAKSGTRRTNPLVYLPEADLGTAGERMFIFGSKGGAPPNPGW